MGGVVGKEVDSEHTASAHGNKLTLGAFLAKHGRELLGCAMCW